MQGYCMKLSSVLFKLFNEVQDFTHSDTFEACSKSEIKCRPPKNVKAPNSEVVEFFISGRTLTVKGGRRYMVC